MIGFLDWLGHDLYALLWQPSLEFALLALVAVIASRALHQQVPAVRYLLWFGLLLKPIASLVFASPWTLFTPFLSVLGSLSTAAPEAGMRAVAGASVAVPPVTQPSLSLAGIAAAAWLLGATLMVGRILAGTTQIARLRREARRHTRDALAAALDRAQNRMTPRRHVGVVASESVSCPLVAGIVRPLIVVPVDLVRTLEDEQIDQILLHELAHVRRLDNLVLLIHHLVAVVFFFHPAVWLCARMLRREADLACDDLVVNATGRSQDYAIGLSRIAELLNKQLTSQRRYAIMSNLGAGQSDLALRIRRAFAGSARRLTTRTLLLIGLLAIGIGFLVLPMAAIAQDRGSTDMSDSETIQAQLEEIGRELRAAVEAGEITGEQARERYEAARVHLGIEDDGEQNPDDALQRRVIGAAMATPADEWSPELRDAIVQAGFDLDEFRTRIRQRQAWAAVEHTAPEAWTPEQVELLVAAGLDPDDVAARIARASQESQDGADARQEGIELRIQRIEQAIADGTLSPEEGRRLIEETRRNAIADAGSDDGLREFQRGVVERAMAQAPEAWNDRLKAAIERAGWDLGEFTEAIRQRQAAGAEVDVAEVVRFLTDASTAIEARSWGQVKREITEQR